MKYIQLEPRGDIAIIKINRPEALNAVNIDVIAELSRTVDIVGADDGIRAVIITGVGERAFCAGADIAYMVNIDPIKAEKYASSAQAVLNKIEILEKPVIAAVNGPAAGAGCNLALACDIRIASTAASFTESFIKVGLNPDWGGTYFLPRLVTPNKACELFFLGETITAQEAARLNIVNKVVAPEDLESATLQLAERLRAAPPIALAAAKQAVYASEAHDLETMLRNETEAQLRCFESDDCHEGVRAFLEKREPHFTGH